MNKDEVLEAVKKADLMSDKAWQVVLDKNPVLQRTPKIALEPMKVMFVKGYSLGYIKRIDEETKVK